MRFVFAYLVESNKLCDDSGTETVASYVNFQKIVDHCNEQVQNLNYMIKWSDGTAKQYKNVGTAFEEKLSAVKKGIKITTLFLKKFPGP